MTVDLDPDGWRLAAACRGHDPDLWHPEKGDTVTAAKALAICARCPVIEPCRAHAVEHRERGIWGGTSERQRKTIRSKAHTGRVGIKVAACGTDAGYYRHLRRLDEDPCEPCRQAHRIADRERSRRRRERAAG